MLTCRSSAVITNRYMRSPCILRFPGGGFQPLMVSTFRHCRGFQSRFWGCSGHNGRSRLPGRMYSGGVQSMGSISKPFFRFPLSPKSPSVKTLRKDKELQSTPLKASDGSRLLSRSRTWRTWIRASRTVYGSSTTRSTEPSCSPSTLRSSEKWSSMLPSRCSEKQVR